RYLIRSVADALVEVRDGRVVYRPGVDEEILAPRGVTAAAGSATVGSNGSGGQGSSTRRPNKAEQRRLTAEERRAREKRSKELKARVAKLERQVQRAEAEVARLAEQLAAPDIYDDHQKVRARAGAHDAGRANGARLMEEWEQAQAQLDAALAD